MATNSTSPVRTAPDLGKPQFDSHTWLEPLIVVSIMIGSLVVNRHRHFSILGGRGGHQRIHNKPLLDEDAASDYELDDDEDSKKRTCFGRTVITPETSRFRNNIHARVLQKFPFLVEMFYWALNYAAYSVTKVVAANFYDGKGNGVVQLAQDHGIGILWLEHESIARIFFPLSEASVQGFFIDGHSTMMTILNRAYSIVHIPGTVLYLSWYYYAAPDHDTFAIARRTMTLGNFAAFLIFSLWPCMPPRLLPESYGFHDTVRQDHAESVWTGGKNVNQLAAMPSLHFTYAFVIGCTFIYHSRRLRLWKRLMYGVAGIVYPMFVLLVIVSTANHYYMDAVVATVTVTLSFLLNKVWYVLLPAEDWLCWLLRVDRPKPTTGMRWQQHQAKEWNGEV